jgi:general stress protein YciG
MKQQYMKDASGRRRLVRDSAYYAAIGRKGGLSTKRRMLAENPDFYSQIGIKGGNAMLDSYGIEFFSAIGRMNGRRSDIEIQEAREARS